MSELERGNKDPRLPTLRALAVGLDVPVSWLIARGDVTDPPYSPVPVGTVFDSGAFGERVATARAERGLSMRALKRALGNSGCAADLERGLFQPHLGTVYRLAGVLWLLSEPGAKEPAWAV